MSCISVDEHLKQLWPEKDVSSFVWNIWTELQYAYRDPDYRMVQAAVLEFIERLVAAVGEEDHRLKGIVHQVGSSFEGTRVGHAKEYDFNVELVNLNCICDVVTSSECPNGFAYLVKKPEVNVEDGGYDQLFDENGTLLAAAVSFMFQSTWLKVLSWQKFWDTEPLLEITKLSRIYMLLPDKLVNDIKLRFNRPVNGKLLHYAIFIDVVPVVRVDGWWPQNAVQRRGNIRQVCNFVFDQPRLKHGATHSTKPHVRISFALAESMLIRDSPPVVRAAFMVAKHIVSKHPDEVPAMEQPKISSHTLKMATLWSLEDVKNSSQSGVSPENDYGQLDSHQLQRQVEAIFRRLWQFSVQDFVPSYLVPSVRFPVWSFEKFPKFSHIFLRQTYSDYRKLFGGREEPNKYRKFSEVHETRRNIKSALSYSFALLYAVSNNSSWSTDWIFPTVTDDH